MSKAILSITREDILDVVGGMQLCAGQIAGVEAAIQFMRSSWLAEESEAILMVDAKNAFNSLNRDCALHNIRYIRPPLATVVINIYRNPTELFVGDETLLSSEWHHPGRPFGNAIIRPRHLAPHKTSRRLH